MLKNFFLKLVFGCARVPWGFDHPDGFIEGLGNRQVLWVLSLSADFCAVVFFPFSFFLFLVLSVYSGVLGLDILFLLGTLTHSFCFPIKKRVFSANQDRQNMLIKGFKAQFQVIGFFFMSFFLALVGSQELLVCKNMPKEGF